MLFVALTVDCTLHELEKVFGQYNLTVKASILYSYELGAPKAKIPAPPEYTYEGCSHSSDPGFTLYQGNKAHRKSILMWAFGEEKRGRQVEVYCLMRQYHTDGSMAEPIRKLIYRSDSLSNLMCSKED